MADNGQYCERRLAPEMGKSRTDILEEEVERQRKDIALLCERVDALTKEMLNIVGVPKRKEG